MMLCIYWLEYIRATLYICDEIGFIMSMTFFEMTSPSVALSSTEFMNIHWICFCSVVMQGKCDFLNMFLNSV